MKAIRWASLSHLLMDNETGSIPWCGKDDIHRFLSDRNLHNGNEEESRQTGNQAEVPTMGTLTREVDYIMEAG